MTSGNLPCRSPSGSGPNWTIPRTPGLPVRRPSLRDQVEGGIAQLQQGEIGAVDREETTGDRRWEFTFRYHQDLGPVGRDPVDPSVLAWLGELPFIRAIGIGRVVRMVVIARRPQEEDRALRMRGAADAEAGAASDWGWPKCSAARTPSLHRPRSPPATQPRTPSPRAGGHSLCPADSQAHSFPVPGSYHSADSPRRCQRCRSQRASRRRQQSRGAASHPSRTSIRHSPRWDPEGKGRVGLVRSLPGRRTPRPRAVNAAVLDESTRVALLPSASMTQARKAPRATPGNG